MPLMQLSFSIVPAGLSVFWLIAWLASGFSVSYFLGGLITKWAVQRLKTKINQDANEKLQMALAKNSEKPNPQQFPVLRNTVPIYGETAASEAIASHR